MGDWDGLAGSLGRMSVSLFQSKDLWTYTHWGKKVHHRLIVVLCLPYMGGKNASFLIDGHLNHFLFLQSQAFAASLLGLAWFAFFPIQHIQNILISSSLKTLFLPLQHALIWASWSDRPVVFKPFQMHCIPQVPKDFPGEMQAHIVLRKSYFQIFNFHLFSFLKMIFPIIYWVFYRLFIIFQKAYSSPIPNFTVYCLAMQKSWYGSGESSKEKVFIHEPLRTLDFH